MYLSKNLVEGTRTGTMVIKKVQFVLEFAQLCVHTVVLNLVSARGVPSNGFECTQVDTVCTHMTVLEYTWLYTLAAVARYAQVQLARDSANWGFSDVPGTT